MKYSLVLDSVLPPGKKGIRQTFVYKVKDSNNINVAELFINLDKTNSAYLFGVEVYEEFRNKRIGYFLMKSVTDLFEILSIKYAHLYVHFDNEIAQKLYKSVGFTFSGEMTEFGNYKMEYSI